MPAKAKHDEPLYVHVARALRDEIVNGIYPVGSQLPTEDKLCARFSVSRHTVRDALRRLREDSLVSSRKGSGTIVVPPPSSNSHVLHAMSIDDLLAYARGMRLEIDSIGMELVGGRLASKIGVISGDEWLAVRGIGQTKGSDFPECWAEYYINREFASVGRVLRRHDGPIFPLIEDMFGQTIVEINQEISASVILPPLTKTLKAKARTAAVVVRRTYTTAEGKIAQVTIVTHPASRFRHSMTLRRVKSST